MTIEQKAGEIAINAVGYYETTYRFSDVMGAARLGIIEGLEMAAKRVETVSIVMMSDPHHTFAKAIRALIEEQKV